METAAPGRILYLNHDLPRPSGGVRAVYDHVAILNRHGLPAYVVHGKHGFTPGWFTETVPTLYLEDGLDLRPADVLVVPEDYEVLEHLKSATLRKIVFCQNHFFIFKKLPPGETWRTLGVTHVLSSSEIIADFIRKNLGWSDVPVVHCAIDPRLFKPGKKRPQIAYMPRKLPLDAGFIRGLFSALGPNAAEVQWVEIDGLPAQRVAEILAESAIFLSLSHLEGLGLPPIEAMASGCVVVGYHGFGGLEYAREENGFWCEEGNPIACAQKLKSLVEMIRRDDPRVKQVIEAGLQVAARYSPQRQEEELLRFMKGILAG